MDINKLSLELSNGRKELVRALSALANRYNMIKDIAILPDFHLKDKMEVPSSVTFAVKDNICFSLSSPEQNCGMSVVLTPLSREEIAVKHIGKFFNEIRTRIPLPSLNYPKIEKKEVLEILLKGAEWVCQRYDLNSSLLQSIENQGNVLTEKDVEDFSYRTVIPDELLNIARYIFCHVGDGNHFLEMQYVDRIIDSDLCDILGIKKGQITVTYHSGSGYFGSMLGRYYAHRTKNTLRGHVNLFPKKIRFHLSNIPHDSFMLDRIRSYLLWQKFVFLNADSSEGKRAIFSIKASMNYGYANRMSVFAEISRAFEKLCGLKKEDISIFWDYSHNSICKEKFKGSYYWMHRHNTCRIQPKHMFAKQSVYNEIGQPVFIPGFNTTSSYLGVAGRGIENSLYSIDHGTGKSIENAVAEGLSKQLFDRETMIYGYKSDSPKIKKHFTNEGISSVINLLTDKNIIRPIARLRPIAALKG